MATKAVPEMPLLLTSVTDDPTTGRLSIFALNRSQTETLEVEVDLRGFGGDVRVETALELHHANLKAINSKDAPEVVKPAPLEGVQASGGKVVARLKPLSWNVIALDHGGVGTDAAR